MGAEGAEPRRRRCPEGRGLAEGAEPRAEVRKPGRAPHVEVADDPQAVGGEAAARCEPVGVRREEEEGVGTVPGGILSPIVPPASVGERKACAAGKSRGE